MTQLATEATTGIQTGRDESSLSFTGAEWTLRPADQDVVDRIQRELKLHPYLARTMALRGVSDGQSAESFLSPGLDALHDPYLMFDMDRAVERLRRAAAEKERIRVVTDYDVDGTTSSLILQGTLKLLGVPEVSYHIPHRFEEGYGFSLRAAEKAAEDGVQLIVTADIGVKDHASVTRARELGLDVIVLDHHLPPGDDVPQDANAVLCPPQQRCSYPNSALAACGVSLKLAQALLADHPSYDPILKSLLKMAAIGTVADIVDLLTPENRAIVSLGLAQLNQGRHRPGLSALLGVAGTQRGHIDAGDLGFRVGPRINAAGRIDSANRVVELLTCNQPELAHQLARDIDAMNRERRDIQRQMVDLAMDQIPDPLPPFVVVAGEESEGWHRGVAGIVAARIRDKVNRPTAVIAITDDGATGSVRSIPQVHAVQCLDAASHLLSKFGGHPAAAGFSLPMEKLPELAQTLSLSAADQLGGKPPELIRKVDLEIRHVDLGRPLTKALQVLGPHGKGNPHPRLLVRGAEVRAVRVLKGKHLKARVTGGRGESIDVVWWGAAEHAARFESGRQLELLGMLEFNVFNGQERVQLRLKDARFA